MHLSIIIKYVTAIVLSSVHTRIKCAEFRKKKKEQRRPKEMSSESAARCICLKIINTFETLGA